MVTAQYKNVFRLLDEIGASSALTDWKRSSLYSPQGVEVDSPVFQSRPRLPTPLGQFVHTLTAFARISVPDRLSLWRLAPALAEYQREYERYDGLSAAELMRAAGVAPRLYRGFLEPLLLATLFAPPEALSAAVTIGAFDFLVLGSQVDSDAARPSEHPARAPFPPPPVETPFLQRWRRRRAPPQTARCPPSPAPGGSSNLPPETGPGRGLR